MEATTGSPLQYVELFGSKRRLPESGTLTLDNIQRVVLGWSKDDESWHLGLLLEAPLAQKRGSRWCEIARWPDPDTHVFGDIASQAGRSLARTITRPFNLIEPQTDARPALPPAPPLRPVPLEFDLWTLENAESLELKRSSSWARKRIIRFLWYTLLMVAYIGLSVLTLKQVIALPKPELLPYLGLVTAGFLFVMAMYTLFKLFREPNRITFNNDGVAALRGNSERWRVPINDIKAVYVSEVVNKKGKKRQVYHGELNLYLHDGRFQLLLDQPQMAEDPATAPDPEPHDGVILLSTREVRSDLQTAGLHISKALNVECRYDQRLR